MQILSVSQKTLMDSKIILKFITTKVSKHIPSGFSMSTISSFRRIENNHDVCRSEGRRKTFCGFLKEHAIKIINFKKKRNEVIIKRAAGII